MGLLLAFAPFLVFVLVERLAAPKVGLVAAALVSGALLLRDWMSRKKNVKVLELGTFLLFGGFAAYTIISGTAWSVAGVRLCVDTGLLLIVLISIAIRRPFTLAYAREETPRETWSTPAFMRTNYVITAVWAMAFAAMTAADLAMLYLTGIPLVFGVAVTVLALLAAVRFTADYPARVGKAVK